MVLCVPFLQYKSFWGHASSFAVEPALNGKEERTSCTCLDLELTNYAYLTSWLCSNLHLSITHNCSKLRCTSKINSYVHAPQIGNIRYMLVRPGRSYPSILSHQIIVNGKSAIQSQHKNLIYLNILPIYHDLEKELFIKFNTNTDRVSRKHCFKYFKSENIKIAKNWHYWPI